MFDLVCSIVVYNHTYEMLKPTIDSVLDSTLKIKLIIVDNSEISTLGNELPNNIEYIKTDRNIGYGSGHNIAIRKALELDSKYHLVLNPDVCFGRSTLDGIFGYMERNPDVGQLMPKVIYPDGRLQRLCKQLPTPKILMVRMAGSILPKKYVDSLNCEYEMHALDYEQINDVPLLSGCFMFLRTDVLREVGMFDENFFMYLEDYDLCRRIGEKSRVVYFPDVTIVHNFEKGSYKSWKLKKYHIASAVKYFNKWGWI